MSTNPDDEVVAQGAASPRADETASSSLANGISLAVAALFLFGALGFAIYRSGAWPSAAQTAPAGAGTPAGANPLATLEARANADPNNADAWVQLGQARFDENDYAGAVTAYRKATELAPAVANIWSALGEAMVMASPSGGPALPDAALGAFRRAATLDAKDPRARYFLAVKQDVDGDHAGAVTAWLALLADTSRGAPWENDLRRTIEQVGARNHIDVAQRIAATRQPAVPTGQVPAIAQAIPGPSHAQMQQAAAMPKGQQDMMVQSMVDGLQAKLDADPRQPDRWLMLIRSRMTLGQAAQARAAMEAAVRANPADAARIRQQSQVLGVPGA